MAVDVAVLGRRLVEEVWATGDLAVAREVVAQEVCVHSSRAVEPGPEGQAEVGDYFRSGFSDARWQVEDAFAAGDRAAVRWRMTGRHDGVFELVEPTGREVQLVGIVIVRVDGAMIAEIWHAEDMLELLMGIGAKPEASAARAN